MKKTMPLLLALALLLFGMSAHAAQTISTFPMTLEDFDRAITASVEKLSAPEWHKDERSQGSVTTSQKYLISNYTGAIVKAPNAGNAISDVMVLLTVDSATPNQEIFTFVMSFGAALEVVAPEISANERGAILRELGLLGNTFPDKQTKVQKGNIICTFAKSTATPTLILTVYPAK